MRSSWRTLDTQASAWETNALMAAPIPMASPLQRAIAELAEQAGEQGISMGDVVDALEQRGFAPPDVEHEIWEMLSQRRLTPSGFVCRTMRRSQGKTNRRIYEFLLVPWSPELDGQLELDLDGRR
jgi:hypothetical protein